MIRKFKNAISLLFTENDTNTEEGRDRERMRRIMLTAITAMLARGASMLIPFVTVKITLKYLGEEVYGLWTTVTSFFALFAYADLGLGSGLQTELSRLTGKKDNGDCEKLVSTTFTILCGVSLLLLCCFFAVFNFIDWSELVNAQTSETKDIASLVVISIVVPIIANIPIGIVQRTQNAMQEGYRTNLWQLWASLISLFAVILVYFFDCGRVTMIAVSSSVPVIVSFINLLVYFLKQRSELCPKFYLFNKKIALSLLNTGIAFFVLSIFTSISLSIDNWIVAQTSTLSTVTPYSIMLKIANVVNVVSIMLSTPLWTAVGEALERNDIAWVKKRTKQITILSAVLAIGMSCCIIILIGPVLCVLTDGVVKPNYYTLIGMCALNVLVSVTNPYFMVLNASRIIKYQIVNYIIYALVSLPLKFFFGHQFGVYTIPWIGAITYLILLTIPTVWKEKKIIGE